MATSQLFRGETCPRYFRNRCRECFADAARVAFVFFVSFVVSCLFYTTRFAEGHEVKAKRREFTIHLRQGYGGQAKGTKEEKDMALQFDDLSHKVIKSAIEVHKNLGPGLLESAYEQCLAYELKQNDISFKLQVARINE